MKKLPIKGFEYYLNPNHCKRSDSPSDKNRFRQDSAKGARSKEQENTQTSNLKPQTRLSVGTGFYFGLCLTLIFVARFFIEFTKENQVSFEDGMALDMGQLLSIPFINSVIMTKPE